MKDLCIVHVGMHKTGTSSIQNILFRNLSDRRFHFANLETDNQSSAIYSLFADNPENYHIHRALGRATHEVLAYNEKNRRLLIDGFYSCGNSVTELISGEDIGGLNESELTRLKRFLGQHFTTVKIIAYIRTPVSYITSAWQEIIKHGKSEFDFFECNPNYIRFAILARIFGRENLILRPFIREQLIDNDVVKDFFHTLGIDYDENAPPVSDNETLTFEALQLIYIFNKFQGFCRGENFYRDRDLVLSVLSGIGQTKITLSFDLIEKIVKKNINGIRFVEAHMGMRFDDGEACSGSEITVTCEDDLFDVSDRTLAELKCFVSGEPGATAIPGKTPQEVAALLELLRAKLTSGYQPRSVPK